MNNLFTSIQAMQRRLTEAGVRSIVIGGVADHEDAAGVIRRQSDALDEKYIVDWLRQFEQAFDDSTLVATFHRLRRQKKF